MDLQLPAWISALPKEEQEVARSRFLLRYAALCFSRDGRLNALSEACGFHPSSLSGYDAIPAALAVALEELIGRETCPRELFRPDLFIPTEG